MSRTILRFGDCRLDIAARSLWRNGARVELPPIVFDAIAYLIAHRQRAVGRDELVAAVWGKSAITDTMLGKAILAARRAIGDSAEAQALIRTIPRYGYHWVGAVSEESGAAEEAGERVVDAALPVAESHEPQLPAMRRGRRLAAFVFGASLIAVIALALLWTRRENGSASSDPATAADAATGGALVVLPLDVAAGADDAWLRLGLMDLIANRLRNAGLPVMSSDSVMSLLKQKDATPAGVAGSLRRADAHARLIRASIAKTGADWSLHAEIDDASGDRHSVDAHAADAVSAARDGADRLLERLGKRAGDHDPRAAELSLSELMQRTEAARLSDDLDVARGLLEAAPPALQALPEVRLRRAQIELRGGRFDDARIQLERLLADVPATDDPILRARALVTLCNAHGRLGQPREAIATCSEAIALVETRDAPEPLAIAYNNRAITHSRQREFAEAEADFARARIAFERSGDALALVRLDGNEASMTMARGRPAEALPILVRAGERFEQFGLYNEALIGLTNQVGAQRALLLPAAALAASERGWLLLGRVQDRNLQHYFKRERAEALAANGRLAEAHALLDELIGDIDAAQESATLGLVKASQAALELQIGQAGIAAALAGQAVAALPIPEDAQPRAAATLTGIRALRRLGRDADATAALSDLTGWAARANMPLVTLYAELAAAEQVAASQPGAPARDHYERALALSADLNLPYLTALVADTYARVLIAQGELEPATVVVGRIARYAENDFDCALLQARLYRALGQREAWQATLTRVRRLAGERTLPAEVATFSEPRPLQTARD